MREPPALSDGRWRLGGHRSGDTHNGGGSQAGPIFAAGDFSPFAKALKERVCRRDVQKTSPLSGLSRVHLRPGCLCCWRLHFPCRGRRPIACSQSYLRVLDSQGHFAA